MKKVLIAILIVAVAIVIGIVAAFYLTAGVVDAADRFFTAVKEGDVSRAYGGLSKEFQATTTIDELRAFLEQSSLVDYKEAKWDSRSIENDRGLLEGVIETAEGGKVPVEITLVKEDGDWKLLSIHKAAAGLAGSERSKDIPGVDQLRRMTDKSIQELAMAISSGDFGDFHQSIAKLWQAQTTKEELYEAFRSFSEQGIDLTVLSDLEPVFSEEPQVGDDGVLRLTGYYPSQPSVAYFDLAFVYEHPGWRLSGISVELK